VHDSDFIDIPSRNFYGMSSRSPNGLYTIAWSEGDSTSASQRGPRVRNGRYFLLKNKKILAKGRMAQPNDGKVANNGIFILHDWGLGDALKGTFHAFDASGLKIITRVFSANLFNNGISPDGRIAACQACNAPDTAQSGVLAVFDLTRGAQIANFVPESGWADYYKFTQNDVIGLGYRSLGAFRYNWNGEFLDREAWHEAQLVRGSYGSVLVLVDRLLKSANGNPPSDLTEKLLKAIERVFDQIPPTDPKSQATAMKLSGICLEAQGNLHEALNRYGKALALNPHVAPSDTSNV